MAKEITLRCLPERREAVLRIRTGAEINGLYYMSRQLLYSGVPSEKSLRYKVASDKPELEEGKY